MQGATRSALLTFVLWPIASLEAQRMQRDSGLVSRIDHVMFTGGLELDGLIELLRDKFQLPVVFDGRSQTPPTPGVCFSFGNTCLEIVPLRGESGDPPRAPRIGSLALEARNFGTLGDSLKARGIDHFPPAEQARWTTIGLRGLGGGAFFIEFRTGMSERGARFRQLLDERQGGPLGVVRVVELSRIVPSEREEVGGRWTRVFGEPIRSDSYLWTTRDGPAIRVAAEDSLANRVVVEVRSVTAAATALRRLGVPFTETNGTVMLDPQTMFGLGLVLVGGSAPPAQGDTVTILSGALELKGLFWRPQSNVPVPAVLFHHGGGCADVPAAPRNLGPRFADRGYAFLWLYRRGAGASRGQGECAFQQIAVVRAEQGDEAALNLQVQLLTTSELSDAMAGLAALRKLPGVDPTRIVVAGHSFGGQLAILSAERDSALRAVLSLAGAAAVWSRSQQVRARLFQALGTSTVPLFLGYATDDNDEPGRIMAAELKRLNKVHQLAIYPSGGHNFVFAPAHPSDVDIFRFLATHVRR